MIIFGIIQLQPEPTPMQQVAFKSPQDIKPGDEIRWGDEWFVVQHLDIQLSIHDDALLYTIEACEEGGLYPSRPRAVTIEAGHDEKFQVRWRE